MKPVAADVSPLTNLSFHDAPTRECHAQPVEVWIRVRNRLGNPIGRLQDIRVYSGFEPRTLLISLRPILRQRAMPIYHAPRHNGRYHGAEFRIGQFNHSVKAYYPAEHPEFDCAVMTAQGASRFLGELRNFNAWETADRATDFPVFPPLTHFLNYEPKDFMPKTLSELQPSPPLQTFLESEMEELGSLTGEELQRVTGAVQDATASHNLDLAHKLLCLALPGWFVYIGGRHIAIHTGPGEGHPRIAIIREVTKPQFTTTP